MSGPRIHFISGLPRSGSTLLAALLRQNPRFHARMSSPVCDLFGSLIHAMGGEGSIFITPAQRVRILQGLFDSYFSEFPDKPVVFDTNRMWCAKLPALLTLYPDAKIVCMVRNVAWIMDSIERLIRRNAFEPSKLFGDGERATVYSRCDALGSRDRLVGMSWTAMKEAFYGAQADNLLVVEYEYLTRAPMKTLSLIYSFLGEVPFEHDVNNVEYDEPEFDGALNTPGLHKVGRQVRYEERRTLLPPDLFERFDKLSFWNDPAPSLANLIRPGAST